MKKFLITIVLVLTFVLTGCNTDRTGLNGQPVAAASKVDDFEVSRSELDEIVRLNIETPKLQRIFRKEASSNQRDPLVAKAFEADDIDYGAFRAYHLTRLTYLAMLEAQAKRLGVTDENSKDVQVDDAALETISIFFAPTTGEAPVVPADKTEAAAAAENPSATFVDMPDALQAKVRMKARTIVALGNKLKEMSNDDIYRLVAYQVPQVGDDRCISHILITAPDPAGESTKATNAEATAALNSINKIVKDVRGGADFATLATASSADPGSAAMGGLLNCANKDKLNESTQQFVPPFPETVAKATLNKITDPIRTQFGYHSILVTDAKVRVRTMMDNPSDEDGLNNAFNLLSLLVSYNTSYNSPRIETDQKIGKWTVVEPTTEGGSKQLRVVPDGFDTAKYS